MTSPVQPDHPDISTDCRGGLHLECFGYISPLISGRDRPCCCQIDCHADGSGREPDFELAVARAQLRRRQRAEARADG